MSYGCHICESEAKAQGIDTYNIFAVADVDALCDKHRRETYDKKECGHCKKKWEQSMTGWYVPSFGGYMDTEYYCPDCIKFYNTEYIRKNKRLKEIPGEIKALMNKAREPELSYIEERDGDYFSYDDGGVSYNQFILDVEYYKKNRAKILKARKYNEDIQEQLEKLRAEEKKCLSGSGFEIKANT